MEILAGDIGGTHSRLIWAAVEPGAPWQVRHETTYASADFVDAESLLARFLLEAAGPVRPVRLALALPGAVVGDRARLTNLDWTLDAGSLKNAFGFAEVRFLNDFQAAANGVSLLTHADLVTLNPGEPEPAAARAITGAGTGLGVGYMTPVDGGWRCHASEGGHMDFAPADTRQEALLASLRTAHAHVSWERVVSGMGFDALYRFCCAERGCPLPDDDGQPVADFDGARVGQLARTGDAAANAALDLFVDLYGAWVGNLALLYRPASGLYIAGGVALHLSGRMQSPRFLDAAFAKGRMRGVVERTPIHLITNKQLGLMGALHAGLDAVRHWSSR